MKSIEMNLRRMAAALAGVSIDDDPGPLLEMGADMGDETRGAIVMCLVNEANHLREMQGGGMVVLSRAFLELVEKTLLEIATQNDHCETGHSRLLDLHNLLARALEEQDDGR